MAMDKGIGVSNEFKVATSIELDNDTRTLSLDLDPGAAGALTDDAALT